MGFDNERILLNIKGKTYYDIAIILEEYLMEIFKENKINVYISFVINEKTQRT